MNGAPAVSNFEVVEVQTPEELKSIIGSPVTRERHGRHMNFGAMSSSEGEISLAARMPSYGVGQLSQFHEFEQVGEGSYGYVYRATCKLSGEVVALKKLAFSKTTNGLPLNSIREIKILKQFATQSDQHPNIILLKDIVTSKGCAHVESTLIDRSLRSAPVAPKLSGVVGNGEEKEDDCQVQPQKPVHACPLPFGNLYLVFEYVPHDLSGMLDSGFVFSPAQVRRVARQLVVGLARLHSQGIIHRDIKSANILLTHDCVVKIADFGLARVVGRSDRGDDSDYGGMFDLSANFTGVAVAPPPPPPLTNNVVTLWYRAPELLLGSTRYSNKIDIWSAGCVVAELQLRRPLFGGKTELEQLDMICRLVGTPTVESYPSMFDLPLFNQHLANMRYYQPTFVGFTGGEKGSRAGRLSPAVHTCLFEQCLVINPASRWSADQILAGPFFCEDESVREAESLADILISSSENDAAFHEFQIKLKKKELSRQRKEAAAVQNAESGCIGSGSTATMDVCDTCSDTVSPTAHVERNGASSVDGSSEGGDDSPIVIRSFKTHTSDTNLQRHAQKRKLR